MWSRFLPQTRSSRYDVLVVVGLVLGGAIYHHSEAFWSNGLLGGEPDGDAHFWWEGAVRVADGCFENHPGKGFRPGYFALTGVALGALGPDHALFHKFLVLNFLAAATLLYFALRTPLGRLASACGIALLIFNPYTAEWLATTTTDGLGLVLHLGALACLLLAVQADFHRGLLIGFGALFAIATLTRPILTPFIGLVPLVLVLLPLRPWRQRLISASVTVGAFCLPAIAWMAAQRATVGEWSISTNDASALYAASTPYIQVWGPNIYEAVESSARARLGRQDLTAAEVNAEFRRQALNNYRIHLAYHLGRLVPHVWAVATFSPSLATHGSARPQTKILALLAGLLALQLMARRQWSRSLVLLAAGVLFWLTPWAVGLMTVCGCALSLLVRPGRSGDLVGLLLAWYWLIGVLGLFLTGGTWQPVFSGPVEINALGYRIGSQFFFAGDLLACALLVRLATLNLPPVPFAATANARLSRLWNRLAAIGAGPQGRAAAVLGVFLLVVALADTATLVLGTVHVAHRAYVNAHSPQVPYPSTDAVVTWHRKALDPQGVHGLRIAANETELGRALRPDKDRGPESADVLLTATTNVCLWALPGQERSVVNLHLQENRAPFRMDGSGLLVEAPRQLAMSEWARRQGAFILRGTLDLPPPTHLKPHQIGPAIRAYVPLAPDGLAFDFEHATLFPLTRYASQLHAAGSLEVSGSALTWVKEAPAPVLRRLRLVTPKDAPAGRPVALTVKLQRAVGKRQLQFQWQPDVTAGPQAPRTALEVWAITSTSPGRALLLTQHDDGAQGEQAVDVDCSQNDLSQIEIAFRGLGPGSGVLLSELRLTADDFRP